MVIDYFLGFLTGGMLGFLIAGLHNYFKNHKTDISESLGNLRSDIYYLRNKVDDLVSKLPKV